MSSKLNSSQRSFLRSKAHHLDSLLHIGKNGLSPSALGAIDRLLESHELIKIKFREYKDKKDELMEKIIYSTSCVVVGVIGHTFILYRQNKDVDRRKIIFPG